MNRIKELFFDNAPKTTIESWDDIKKSFINRLVVAFAVSSIPACIAAIVKDLSIGHVGLNLVYALVATVSILIAVFRRKISDNFKINYAILNLNAVGLIGIYCFGTTGVSATFLLASNTLVALIYGTRSSYVYSMITFLAMMAVGWYHVTYHPNLGVIDFNIFLELIPTWVSFIMSYSLLVGIMGVVLGTMYESVQKLLTELKEKNAEILALAQTDKLTGLWNVRVAHERLGHLLEKRSRGQHSIYILFMDLDGFKSINDRHGHPAGDFALVTVAARLRDALRKEDLVARIGGDEFLCVIEMDEHPPVPVDVIAERIIRSVSMPFDYEGNELKVGASIGIFELMPSDTKAYTPKCLIEKADQAMYDVKHRGKNGYCFYQEAA